ARISSRYDLAMLKKGSRGIAGLRPLRRDGGAYVAPVPREVWTAPRAASWVSCLPSGGELSPTSPPGARTPPSLLDVRHKTPQEARKSPRSPLGPDVAAWPEEAARGRCSAFGAVVGIPQSFAGESSKLRGGGGGSE